MVPDVACATGSTRHAHVRSSPQGPGASRLRRGRLGCGARGRSHPGPDELRGTRGHAGDARAGCATPRARAGERACANAEHDVRVHPGPRAPAPHSPRRARRRPDGAAAGVGSGRRSDRGPLRAGVSHRLSPCGGAPGRRRAPGHRAHRQPRRRRGRGARRAPLELIAHVVENDRPYTEILTADYIMANPMAAGSYGAPTRFDDPDDMHEFKPSRVVSYYRRGEGYVVEHDPFVDRFHVPNPGPLITDYPHAGVLNTKVFLQRYPTTATNRNRARSRGGRTTTSSASTSRSPRRGPRIRSALADTNNPTLHNPACTVCHRRNGPGGRRRSRTTVTTDYYKVQLGRNGLARRASTRTIVHKESEVEIRADLLGRPGRR